MGSWFGKSEPEPDVYYRKTAVVRDIIQTTNENHPYVASFLREYPYSVNYTRTSGGGMYCIDHKHTQYDFYTHTHIDLCNFCQLSMTKPQFARLMLIKKFAFMELPEIKQEMTVGNLRDICRAANRTALEHVFKYSPDSSEWMNGNSPIPTIGMHVDMLTVSDKTRITLSARQAKMLAEFLHRQYVEPVFPTINAAPEYETQTQTQ